MKKMLIFLIGLSLMTPLSYAEIPKVRDLEFTYEVSLKDIPQDAKELTLWIPVLPSKDYQEIESMDVISDEEYQIQEEAVYKNQILSYTLHAPFKETYAFKIKYNVKRSEYLNRYSLDSQENQWEEKRSGEFEKYLKPNRLVTITPEIRKIAADITRNKKTTNTKARAIYDYVFSTVRYDKQTPGWGYGDTQRVCDVKSGNCTDFHSLFISLARAADIPAKFVIGAPFSTDAEGETVKYHCWAEFYDNKIGWSPVDISEAWKDKTKVDYLFGGLDENRLEFSQGRDIILNPKQSGDPLNYFVYPYAEVDGVIHKGVGVSFKYKNVNEKIVRK